MMSDPEARINADGIFSIVFSEGQLHRAGFSSAVSLSLSNGATLFVS
jgi:hypothetical protein